MIPLRFFSEAFDCRVDWNGKTYTVDITSPPQDLHVLGYYALGDRETSSWTDLFQSPYPETGTGNTDIVDEVALGWYSLTREGELLTRNASGWQRPDGWEDVLDAAEQYGIRTEMVVHMTNRDGELSGLIADEAVAEAAVEAIMEAVESYNGVNLDLEGLGYRYDKSDEELEQIRTDFTRFVETLASGLHENGKTLTLSLHPPNSVYQGYDYQALGQLADKIVIMAYEYGLTPEPVHLVEEAVKRAVATVSPDKLILGISAATENHESMAGKIGLAKRYGLDGIALWRLGLYTDEMWDSIRQHVVPRNPKIAEK